MSIASLATHTAAFTRPTVAETAMGGQTVTQGSLYSGVRGSLQPANGRLVEEMSRKAMVIDYVFYTATALALRTGDIATVSSTVYAVVGFGDMAGRGQGTVVYLLTRK